MNWTGIALLIQLFFGIVIGLYFFNLLKSQRNGRVSIDKESKKEMDQLRRMRSISLSEPLAERVRPISFDDIVGQSEGIRTLRAALCGPNPQHVLIYGPPGVGKTAAARLVLEEAKRNCESPFRQNAVFVELDGATARFDERGIADPLIGSVHDPIYQGAGAMGQAGIPQPKHGAVTKAHGGMLFIDEIGELHSIQLNKLLKVLEDRKVFLESAYYSEENQAIPRHIHDIFQNGLPADFRLIGATTRRPDEIPPAIRSRCLEVYFHALKPNEIVQIAEKAIQKIQYTAEEGALEKIAKYATNGREVVNIVQISAGVALASGRKEILLDDVEWVLHASQLSPRPEKQIHHESEVGIVNGLAVFGPNMGALLELEVNVIENKGNGQINITGIAEEEHTGNQSRSIKRKSMAKGSVENVVTVLRRMGIPTSDYDIHVNFPGGAPVDGPSAGIAIATGIYSAIEGVKVKHTIAMTGELGIHGAVKPIGGVVAKVEAAKLAGVKTVIVPEENMQALLKQIDGINVVSVKNLDEVLELALERVEEEEEIIPAINPMESASTLI
ncbi:Lon protease [Alkalihalobacillus alcalophilus ATCC 27647 = CGMCC 1.3604]|uniref:endopeptidase La n=1 Tax=Alkalihalobacillus alcalophilus ATCC 27647 = CGMCC 1.3604 TaxID=1218173 RepID=A0A094YX41_ALKAL|nr:ATP-dependent protease LonB [Alkalihalobacillus alcalophilus]KGA98097.1 Lon protease [Alkalihalobacillus alcalophilus ATCC 27647 = CGMCC 1.3604]MED1561434.1 ATP-dependent protease LonB [Alkalihalobacillus alcalophilus]THG90708.1 Lon protease [Alkalihalobacillus alcalophilus ATCC 27647 = CGMCC 1.3604]